MKQTTKDWFTVAEDDLLAAKKLAGEDRLSNVAAFHCQQCLEKCFKAVIEEQDKPSLKSHDLFRLQLYANIQLTDSEKINLGIINEVYIDSRYPGDMGLLSHGKPKAAEIETMIEFCESFFPRLKKQLNQ